LTVNGTNFASGATLQLNGSPRPATVVSSTQMQATLAAADLQTAQTLQVTVTNPAPGGGASNAVGLIVVADKILFSSNRALTGGDAAGPRSNVWSMDADGFNQVPLDGLAGANSFNAVRSPDGSKVAFLSNRALNGVDALNTNSTQNLWVMNADGSAPVALTKYTFTPASEGALTASVAWSPDGSNIAYTSSGALDGSDALAPAFNVWVAKSDGSSRKPLTRGTAFLAGAPVWSPDGGRIAFISTQNPDGSDANVPTNNLWVMNADGSGATALTKLNGPFILPPAPSILHFEPQWSPDGRRISVTANRALDGSDTVVSNLNVWVINADGTGLTPLTRTLVGDSRSAVWSPDGTQIAFVSTRSLNGSNVANPTQNLWIMDASGAGATALTQLSAAFANAPVWAPTGRHIRFFSNAALSGTDTALSVENFWQIDSDRSNKTPLTRLTAANVTQ
jgi:Tol biopolymer transport system component